MSAVDDRAANMLQDVVFELNEMLEESVTESREFQAGMFHVATLLYQQLKSFDVDQSKWPRPMIDPDTWFLGERK